MAETTSLKLSLGELAERINGFVTEFLEGKSPETIGTYRRSLHEFERWFAARKGRFGFAEKDVEAYRTYLAEERELSEASVATYLTALRRLCEYMVSRGELEKNPADNVRGNRRPAKHTRDVLTEEEVAELFEEVDGDSILEKRDRAMLSLMVHAGLSEIELVRADYEDLEQTLLGWFLRVQGKGRKTKDAQVALDEPVVEALQDYIRARGGVAPDAPLLVSHGHRSDGERLQTRT
ncbi:MAG: site-specific integrase, partial [Rubricoccaceae bacterium]|nr:site-specific integrase [Rubricoccaceae bacterium]